eukprot:CAMPEP_0115171444 /NCGR_PEP_ID=MMETSP0270-20121206/2305_1 /TAXON_ID=71861 /ORGANISM="Scrippsiella trochoidea, Strain CCMP3099" /LENGTH=90 /DNA_ID=CAMNT_0002584209 /DNA_START=300 /DNA_END=572 /DNA_ORIENTATION=-
MTKLVLRSCLLQIRRGRVVMLVLTENVRPLSKVVGATILHGLDKRMRRMPLPSDGRGYHDEKRLVELPDITRHCQGLIAVPVGVIRPKPM